MLKNNKEKSIAALKKAQRIIGKMIKMIEAGEPCQNIMSQNARVVILLRRANKLIMEADLNDCLKAIIGNQNQTNRIEMTEEIMTVTKQLIR
ncbi:MAG: metal-sensing transcriptional repressor [Patescibacteria group bacterium]